MKLRINNVVCFKSVKEIYRKEVSGIKPNIVRYFNNVEPKFAMLKSGKAKYIKITMIGLPYQFFIRKIKDVTYWKRLVIISWN